MNGKDGTKWVGEDDIEWIDEEVPWGSDIFCDLVLPDIGDEDIEPAQPMMVARSLDELVVLRSVDGSRLAKRIRAGDGEWLVDGYDNAFSFRVEARQVACFDDLAMQIEQLAKDPEACVIRGQLRDNARHLAVVNRRQHERNDGIIPHWDNHRPGRRWVAFDIDKMPLPVDLQQSLEVIKMVELARSTLPEPFASTACAYHLSASAGLDDWKSASMHLWFWLDRPVFDLSWRRWSEGKGVDPSFFKSVQPHYTADPIWADFPDPMAGMRTGVLTGLRDTVPVPAELEGAADWDRAQEAERKAKEAEREAVRQSIVGSPEQSASATRKYALQALDGAISDILGAVVGTRHETLCAKARKLGGLCQPGFLDESEVLAALERAIDATFPANRQASSRKSAKEFLAMGIDKPLSLDHIGRQATKKKPDLRVVPPPDDDDVPMPEPGSSAAKKKAPAKKSGGVEWVDLDEKGGILSTAPNLAALLDWMGYRPRRNLMNHQTHWQGAPSDIALECRQNAMAGVVIDEAARHGWKLSTEKFWMGLGVVEARGAFHPVVEWARSKPWDGRSRFGDLFETLTVREGFEDCHALLRAQLDKWLIAGGRCLALGDQNASGVAVQGVLVLQGKQDMGKTRWFQSLVKDPCWLSEGLTMDPSNKDHVIQATSSFICELGELDATTRKSDVAQLKAFLTRPVDEYRAPYGRQQETYPRRTIFGATVNPDTFLVDETGNRRFWVMPIDGVNADHGIDIQQLWAEAMARAEAGETYWMPDEQKAAQLTLASRFQTRADWADDFWHHFRLPLPNESGQRLRVSEVRGIIYGDRRFTGAEMRSFAAFIRSTGAVTDMGQNVLHVRLAR